MVANDFVKNAATGFWEATATVNSAADLHIEVGADSAGIHNRHVALFWKGNTADTNYASVEGSTRVPANGVYNSQITSEFYPVYLKVETSVKPTYCRLTEH